MKLLRPNPCRAFYLMELEVGWWNPLAVSVRDSSWIPPLRDTLQGPCCWKFSTFARLSGVNSVPTGCPRGKLFRREAENWDFKRSDFQDVALRVVRRMTRAFLKGTADLDFSIVGCSR